MPKDSVRKTQKLLKTRPVAKASRVGRTPVVKTKSRGK